MSAELDTLDAAINAYIAEAFEGHYTSAWIVVAVSTTVTEPDAANYRIITPTTQPFHTDVGLLQVGAKITDDSWNADSYDEDDDD